MLEEFINNLSVLNHELRHISCKSCKLTQITNELNAYGEMSLYIDKLFEERIVKHLSREKIVRSIYSEESGIIELRKEGYTVLVDPLDGTQNFKMGLPYYALTIAVLDCNNEVVAAYVANLVTGSYYSAIKGKGATYNGKGFFTKTQQKFENIHAIYVGLSKNITELNCLLYISQRINSFRAMGCSSLDLCCLARGNCSLFVDLSNTAKLVDVLASSLIVEEAGAIVTDLQGMKITNIPFKNADLSENVFKSKFRVLGAVNRDIYNFAFKRCDEIEQYYKNNLKEVRYVEELA